MGGKPGKSSALQTTAGAAQGNTQAQHAQNGERDGSEDTTPPSWAAVKAQLPTYSRGFVRNWAEVIWPDIILQSVAPAKKQQ